MSAVPQTSQGYVSENWRLRRDELQCSNGSAPRPCLYIGPMSGACLTVQTAATCADPLERTDRVSHHTLHFWQVVTLFSGGAPLPGAGCSS